MKKANPFSGSFLFPMPAHRIRIRPKDGFGFRPPPFHHRAQARGAFFPRSSNVSSHSSICANLFREPNRLISHIRALRASTQSVELSQRERTDMQIQCGLGFAKLSFLGKGFAKPRLSSARKEGSGRECARDSRRGFFGAGCERNALIDL